MPSKQYPFIDIAVHEHVRTRFAAGEALVLFSDDMEKVLWANGAGAGLFSHDFIYDFLDAGLPTSDVTTRQIKSTAGQLSAVGDRRSFLMRMTTNFQRITVQASLEILTDRAGDKVILFSAPMTEKPLPIAARAKMMLSGFDDPDTHMAVLGSTGNVLASSADFASLAMTAETLQALVSAVSRDADQLLKRPVPTGRGYLPAAIGKLSDDPDLSLLFCVETAIGQMDPTNDDTFDQRLDPLSDVVSTTDISQEDDVTKAQKDALPFVDVHDAEIVADADTAESVSGGAIAFEEVIDAVSHIDEPSEEPVEADAIVEDRSHVVLPQTDERKLASELQLLDSAEDDDMSLSYANETAADLADLTALRTLDTHQSDDLSYATPFPAEFEAEFNQFSVDPYSDPSLYPETVDVILPTPNDEHLQQVEAGEPVTEGIYVSEGAVSLDAPSTDTETLAADTGEIVDTSEIEGVTQSGSASEVAADLVVTQEVPVDVSIDDDVTASEEALLPTTENSELLSPTLEPVTEPQSFIDAGHVPTETVAGADLEDSFQAEADLSEVPNIEMAETDTAAFAEPVADIALPVADVTVPEGPPVPMSEETGATGFSYQKNSRPVRFVWKVDAHGKFSEISEEFAQAVGPRAAAINDLQFADVARAFKMDSDGKIGDLLQKRDTWSGKTIYWPVEGTSLKVPVDLAALPTYSRSRSFDGFRGFGIVRLVDAVEDPEQIGLMLTAAADRTAAESIPETDLLADQPAENVSDMVAEQPYVSETSMTDVELAEPADLYGPTLAESEDVSAEVSPSEAKLDGELTIEPSPDEGTVLDAAGDQTESLERVNEDVQMEPVIPETVDATNDLPNADAAEAAAHAHYQGLDAVVEPDAQPAEILPEDVSMEQAQGISEELTDVEPAPNVETIDASTQASDIAEGLVEIDGNDTLTDTDGISSGQTVEPSTEISDNAADNVIADADNMLANDLTETEDTPSSDPSSPDAPSAPDDFQGERPALRIVENPGRRLSDKVVSIDAHRGKSREGLSLAEQAAFNEIARQLDPFGKRLPAESVKEQSARLEGSFPSSAKTPVSGSTDEQTPARNTEIPSLTAAADQTPPVADAPVTADDVSALIPSRSKSDEQLSAGFVDALPLAILVHTGETLIHANPEFFRLTGYTSLKQLKDYGGLDALLEQDQSPRTGDETPPMMMVTADGALEPVTARLQSIRWEDCHALLLALVPQRTENERTLAAKAAQADDSLDPNAKIKALTIEVDELRSILETATDGVVIVSQDGEIRSMNRSASALFNFDEEDTKGKSFAMLFAHESQKAVMDYLAGLAGHGVASVLNDGREVIGREASGGFIPLFMTMGRLSSSNGYCAVIRDITQWKRTEEELRTAKRAAETANAHKSEFLARVSHEIRTPLNAIIGFSDMMATERLGPIGHPRYVEYSDDIGRSGRHVLDIVNDLLDISKIEAGEMDLDFTSVELNDAVSEAVSLVQPQVNSQRVIIRTSLSQSVPNIVADQRSIKQIAINILANAIRYTPSGGQIVVSTAYEPNGSVVLRIRDTGIGMTRTELEQALKPFRQVTTGSRKRGDGTGLGLPLTKAMVDANRANFAISSAPNEGTLVEITFPSQRVLAN